MEKLILCKDCNIKIRKCNYKKHLKTIPHMRKAGLLQVKIYWGNFKVSM